MKQGSHVPGSHTDRRLRLLILPMMHSLTCLSEPKVSSNDSTFIQVSLTGGMLEMIMNGMVGVQSILVATKHMEKYQ
jgi:hypothetical protein